jgi:cell division protein FtsB
MTDFINGFDNIIKHIRNQENIIYQLKTENKQLKTENKQLKTENKQFNKKK